MSAGNNPAQYRALVVEDDPASRNALVKLLSHHGCLTVAAASIAEGRAEIDARNTGLELLVLDLMLPDGDGIDLLRHVRDRKLPIKVAVVSGVSGVRSLPDLLKLKPEAIFGKPLDIADFLNWMRGDMGLQRAPTGNAG